jgi:hypothetical protein
MPAKRFRRRLSYGYGHSDGCVKKPKLLLDPLPIRRCLDSTNSAVSVGNLRTTITIDADTEALLRLEVERTGLSFKVVLNQAIKRALGRRASGVQVQPLFAAPFPPELAQQSFNRLDAKWEDEDTILELGS